MSRTDRLLFIVGYLLLVVTVVGTAWQVDRTLDQARADRCTIFEVQVAVALADLARNSAADDAEAAAKLQDLYGSLSTILAPVAQSCPELVAEVPAG